VRTTIEPGVVHEVDAAELLDLERQGLIYSSSATRHTDALGLKVGDFARWQAADRGRHRHRARRRPRRPTPTSTPKGSKP
jgi:hypothetical protein